MRPVLKKTTIVLFSVAFLMGAGLLVTRMAFPKKQPEYIAVSAARMDIEETVLASGTLQALKTVDVGAQVSGQLKKLHVKLGDQVKQGTLLAEIDPLLQQNTLRQAEADVENLHAQITSKKTLLRQYELAYRRQQSLSAGDAGSRADLESAEAQLETTRADIAALDAQLKKARVAVDSARVNLAYTRIVAPMNGVVIGIVTEEGQTVVSAQSAPTILKLAALETMTVKAQVSEADITRVKPGQKVYFTILGEPDTRHYGVLRAIEPATEAASSSTSSNSSSSSNSTAIYYNALFDVPNPGRKLRVSMTAQVTILLSTAKQVLTVPVSALQGKEKPGKQTVKVLENGFRVERPVTLGISNNVNVQVLNGLQEGEKVIIGDNTAAPAAATSGRVPGPRPGGGR